MLYYEQYNIKYLHSLLTPETRINNVLPQLLHFYQFDYTFLILKSKM